MANKDKKQKAQRTQAKANKRKTAKMEAAGRQDAKRTER